MTQQSHYWAYTSRKSEFKDTRAPVFIAALFTIARTWKQPRYTLGEGSCGTYTQWNIRFSAVAQSCPWPCHQLVEFTQTHAH